MFRICMWSALSLAVALPGPALADVDAQTRALNEILDAADGICASPVEEHNRRVELTRSAKAMLDSTVKKVADLGIEGASEYQSDGARGSLQQDLATALENSNNCKLTVLTILQEKMIIRQRSEGSSNDVPGV